MADIATSPWWVVVCGALPGTLSGVWVAYRWLAERHDKRETAALTREERLARDVDAQRDSLSRQQGELFERIRSELGRLQARNATLETERDHAESELERWQGLARWWCRRARDVRHSALNAQTIAEGLANRDGLPVPTWPDTALPGLEDPKP